MKNGQSGITILVILGLIIVGILVFIAIKLSYPSAGYVVYMPQQEETTQTPSNNVIGTTVIDPPFYPRGSVIKEDSISLEIMNNGGEDYLISRVDIGPYCTTGEINRPIIPGNPEVIKANCNPLNIIDQNFNGDITIRYTRTNDKATITSRGKIKGKVLE